MTASVPEQHAASSSLHAATLDSGAQPPPLDPDPLPATIKTLISLNASFCPFHRVDLNAEMPEDLCYSASGDESDHAVIEYALDADS